MNYKLVKEALREWMSQFAGHMAYGAGPMIIRIRVKNVQGGSRAALLEFSPHLSHELWLELLLDLCAERVRR